MSRRAVSIAAILFGTVSACGSAPPPAEEPIFKLPPPAVYSPEVCESVLADRRVRLLKIPDVFDLIPEKEARKSEFETAAAYRDRIAAVLRPAMERIRAATGGDHLVFLAPVDRNNIMYDAEMQRLTISSGSFGVATVYLDAFNDTEKLFRAVRTEFHSTRTGGRYVRNFQGQRKFAPEFAETEFGAIITIAETHFGLGGAWPRKDFQHTVAMSPDRAKHAKENLAVMFVATLRAPYVYSDTWFHDATYKEPRTYTVKRRLLVVDVKCASIIVRPQGELITHIR